MGDSWWEIRNGDGDYVCSRGTKRECVELLDEQVSEKAKHWSNGPYTVWRMTAERRYTHRSRPSEGEADRG